jgi:N-acetylmuramoyl-L-alanine amidase
MADWHPHAIRVPGRTAGHHKGGGRKIVWHTTEGSTASNAIAAYRAHGGWPTFTLERRKGGRYRLYQHMGLSEAARALKHPSGPETNRANAVQVELVGFARESSGWSRGHYKVIARLARWIEQNWLVPRTASVRFGSGAARMDGMEFYNYAGHCGHQHVPLNDHTDPGSILIDRVLDRRDSALRTLEVGVSGEDVRELQYSMNLRLHAARRPTIAEDGRFGPETRAALQELAYVLGLPIKVVESGSATPHVAALIQRAAMRSKSDQARALSRRRRMEACKHQGRYIR